MKAILEYELPREWKELDAALNSDQLLYKIKAVTSALNEFDYWIGHQIDNRGQSDLVQVREKLAECLSTKHLPPEEFMLLRASSNLD